MICLNEKMERETEFLDMMNTLLSRTMDVEQKKKELEEKFHLSMESKLGERVRLMCNLSDLVERDAEKRGERRGEIKGEIKGKEEERKNSVRVMLEMLRDIGYSIDEASERVAMKLQMELEEVYKIAEKSRGM